MKKNQNWGFAARTQAAGICYLFSTEPAALAGSAASSNISHDTVKWLVSQGVDTTGALQRARQLSPEREELVKYLMLLQLP